MAKDIVCAEEEISIAVNKLVGYADFLSRTIEDYIQILNDVQQQGGIKDALICNNLTSIAQSLAPYKSKLEDECENIATQVNNDYIAEMSNIDNFTFPSEITARIESLKNQFL